MNMTKRQQTWLPHEEYLGILSILLMCICKGTYMHMCVKSDILAEIFHDLMAGIWQDWDTTA